jgi:protein ImuB
MRRIVSLWLPHFATERIRRASSEAPAGPLATIRTVADRCLLVAVDAAAAAGGLAPGQPLADARALLPQLAVLPADPAGEAATLGRLADWCDRYTPLVGIEAGDGGAGAGLWLDITGCSHLLGGEAELLEDLAARLARLGHAARLGLADTPGAAWAAARFMPGNAVLPPGGAREALAPLPVAALRLPPAPTAGLERLGLRRVADLYPLPRAALARRFGGVVGQRLEQALGALPEPISPRRPVPPFAERLAFPEPIGEAASIAAGLSRLLERLCRRLDAAQRGARRLALALHRVDGSRQDLAIGTSRPSRDPAALGRLFAEALGRIDPGFGIEVMALAATRAEPLSALQIALTRTPATPAAPSGGADLADLIDRLGNRLGFAALGRPVPVQSHWPERAFALAAAPAGDAPWPATPPRPLRLLPRPEPVEAEPVEPGRPPGWFERQGRRHRIAGAEGPERIGPEWWRDEAGAARDYFRLEDQEGGRFWLYREEGREDGPAPARWYLHGLFA